jgi:hypothetical protein
VPLGNGSPPRVIPNAAMATHPGFGAVRHAMAGVLACPDPPRQERRCERSSREPCDSGSEATRRRSEVSVPQDDRPRPPDDVCPAFIIAERREGESNADTFCHPMSDGTAMKRRPERDGQVEPVVSKRHDIHGTEVERAVNVVGIPHRPRSGQGQQQHRQGESDDDGDSTQGVQPLGAGDPTRPTQ